MTAAAFVAAARAYLGVPWRHMGRTAAGVDCIGLLLLAGRDAQIDIPAPPPYSRLPVGHDMAAACAALGRRVPTDQTQDGDILLFSDASYPGHIGMRTTVDGQAYCLHARASRRKVVEEPLRHELLSWLRRAYRHRELEI